MYENATLVQDNAGGRSAAALKKKRLGLIVKRHNKRQLWEARCESNNSCLLDESDDEDEVEEDDDAQAACRWKTSSDEVAPTPFHPPQRPQRKASLTHVPQKAQEASSSSSMSLAPPQMPKRQVSLEYVPPSVADRANKQECERRDLSPARGGALSPNEPPSRASRRMLPMFISASTA